MFSGQEQTVTGSAKAVLCGFWEEGGNAGLGYHKVGGCRGLIARGDEIRGSLGDNGLVFIYGVMVKRLV